jgi:DNA-binding CsgD family transcriptional regulator
MPLLHGKKDLTSREWAITALVYEGFTDAQIASELQATADEIEIYLRRIFDKTGCWNRTEVALWYAKSGVAKERRFDDRREAERNNPDERRTGERRHPPERSPRADQQHEINLNE